MSPSHSPTPSPKHPKFSPTSNPTSHPTSNPSTPSLTPLNTNNPIKRTALQRPPSYAKNRMSSYSTASRLSDKPSRPTSYAFPAFHSSLPYSLVRDFAYPIAHPWHYGPPPEPSEAPSGNSTPASERHRPLSDPPNGTWDSSNPQWSAGPWGGDGLLSSQQLPQMAYGDGPPYSEDEDLHSPVVASRHKKSRSAKHGKGRTSGGDDLEEDDDFDIPPNSAGQRSYFAGINGDGSETYYIGEEDEAANGPGGELVTYPPDAGAQGLLAPKAFGDSQRASRNDDGSGFLDPDDSRFSRDYQFTIASPDEEMHGKAVALFDFARENENELPLLEGQVIWVSYRHGQGWLVAEDPKTGDAGLVPEEYVRLLRDIEGGWNSLNGEEALVTDESSIASPPPTTTQFSNSETLDTPTATDSAHAHHFHHGSSGSLGGKEKRPAIVSTFSTSSKDLETYPHHLLGQQAGATPPAVVHQGSQSNTPTLASPSTGIGTGPSPLGGVEEVDEHDEGKLARNKQEVDQG